MPSSPCAHDRCAVRAHTITCTVAVFNAPGGTPIGSDAVKAGQTFYVNPTPKTAPDGESWTQVFVSSTPDPWIPTRCVQ